MRQELDDGENNLDLYFKNSHLGYNISSYVKCGKEHNQNEYCIPVHRIPID